MKLDKNNFDEKKRVVFLDGIRGWASLMVLLSHLVLFFLKNTVPGLQGWFFGFATDGNLAIFIFFALSGFALSTGYIQSGDRSVIVALAIRRYLRLTIPIFLSCLLAFSLMHAGLMFNGDAGRLFGNVWTTGFYRFPSTFLACIKFGLYDVFFHYDGAVSYNPVLWTMALELWGSFLVFSICALFMHLRKRLILLGFVFAYLFIENSIWYLPFVCGIGIAVFHSWQGPNVRKYARYCWPLVVALVVYYSDSSQRGGAFGLPPAPRNDTLNIVAASAIVFIASCANPVKIFFENALSRYLGSISFPLYLTHFMVICSFSSYLFIWLERFHLERQSSSAINFVASMSVCILVAHLFRYGEIFAIRSARRFSEWSTTS